MRKMIFMLFLATAVIAGGCENREVKKAQDSQLVEDEQGAENTVEESTAQEEDDVESSAIENEAIENNPVESDAGESDVVKNNELENNTLENDVVENVVVENAAQEDDVSEQDTSSKDDDSNSLKDYMASIEEQSANIKASLENDVLTQYDMNAKSAELYKLWDDALNYLWKIIKDRLPEDEFAKLLDEQRAWIKEKEQRAQEAGKEVEGGSMYPLIVNSEAAKITEERVYEFYEMLK